MKATRPFRFFVTGKQHYEQISSTESHLLGMSFVPMDDTFDSDSALNQFSIMFEDRFPNF